MFQKENYNVTPKPAVWRVFRKHLYLKVYKLPIVQHLEGWKHKKHKQHETLTTGHNTFLQPTSFGPQPTFLNFHKL
jgi:hypothetical protein